MIVLPLIKSICWEYHGNLHVVGSNRAHPCGICFRSRPNVPHVTGAESIQLLTLCCISVYYVTFRLSDQNPMGSIDFWKKVVNSNFGIYTFGGLAYHVHKSGHQSWTILELMNFELILLLFTNKPAIASVQYWNWSW